MTMAERVAQVLSGQVYARPDTRTTEIFVWECPHCSGLEQEVRIPEKFDGGRAECSACRREFSVLKPESPAQ